MNTNEITIGNVEYVRKDSLLQSNEGDIKIVVLDRGFVYVGAVEIDGEFLTIHNAKNLRVWGTTKGLGELINGPLSNTKLDSVGTVTAPVRALIHLIDVVQEKWKTL